MKQKARSLALEALIRVEEGGAYSNLLIHQLFNQQPDMDVRDRKLITEIVYGTLQQQMLIDFYLEPFLKKGAGQLRLWVKQLLRLSIYQLIFLDRVPERAIVHEAVEIAKRKGHRGISGLVNGVLRQFIRTPRRDVTEIADEWEQLAVRTSHPHWLVKRWIRQYGFEQTRSLCEHNNLPPQVTIRINPLKTTRAQVMKHLSEQGFELKETPQSPQGILIDGGGNPALTPFFKEGLFSIQDESSMMIAPLLAPQKGMKILDACAAPGGKTAHLAELMQNQGEIIANDVHPHKKRLIDEQMKRLGISIVSTRVSDARDLPKQLSADFDRILIDAPCSGLGVIRRKPDLKWKKKEEDISAISAVQRELLDRLSLLLKPGGELVYSTCTLDREENEEVISFFLQQQPQFRLVEGSMRRLFPDQYGSDGFFMTKLKKEG